MMPAKNIQCFSAVPPWTRLNSRCLVSKVEKFSAASYGIRIFLHRPFPWKGNLYAISFVLLVLAGWYVDRYLGGPH